MSDEMKILPGNVQQLTDNGKGNDLDSYKRLFKALVKTKKKPVPKLEWGWMIQGDEHAHGPFCSREEAVEDAKEYCRTSLDKVIYGTCQWGDPTGYLLSVDELLDSMNEAAFDNDFGFFDGEVFDFSSKEDAKTAEKEYEDFMAVWADKWINSNAWILDPEPTK